MADGKVNKVVYGDDTLIDLTEDTVSEDTLAKGATAHNAQGLAIEGTFEDAIQHIKVNGTEQPIEDNTVDIDVPTKVSELDNDAGYVDSDALDEVKQTADDKVNSVKVGTVTTGDSPSVTNSGTDKDVVMDFVFPRPTYDADTETLIFS